MVRAVAPILAVLGLLAGGGAAGAAPPERLLAVNSSAWMPYAFRDADGAPRGVLVDLWRRVGDDAGIELRFELVPWRRSLERVDARAVDFHAGLTRSRVRAAHFDFTRPLFSVRTQLFARRGAPATHLADLSDAPVGVVDGTVEQRFLADFYAAVATRAFATSEAMVNAAVAGEIDLFVADYPTGYYRLIRQEAIDHFAAVDTLYTDEIRAAVPKGEADLLAFLNARLAALDPAATRAILDRWLVPREAWPTWLWPVLGGVAAGVGGLGFAGHYATLRRTVERRTAELRRTVDALARANAELDRRANVDALTGLANRHRLVDEARRTIERAGRYGRPASLVLVDLDGLKRINDRHGHLEGDAALERVAAVLAAEVRACDLVARWGGDEFVVLLPETGEAAARALATRLSERVAAATVPAATGVSLAVSVGVAAWQPDHGGLDAWLRAADASLYAGKARPAGCR